MAEHGPSMMRTASAVLGRYGRNESDDVVQEAFLAALTTSATPNGDVGAWLRAVTVRKALDSIRRSRRHDASPLVDTDVAPGEPSVPDDVIAVREALGRLTAVERAVLTLVDLEGFSMAEAAAALGTTSVAVRLRAVRARRKLARELREGGRG